MSLTRSQYSLLWSTASAVSLAAGNISAKRSKIGLTMVWMKLICSSGMQAFSRSIISLGFTPIAFSRSPCEKNSL
uniref:Putative secreted protein n=1 Tax=Ixodes ricinus TaxID=34613 RepID=A0A6B0TTJ2_IXORI